MKRMEHEARNEGIIVTVILVAAAIVIAVVIAYWLGGIA